MALSIIKRPVGFSLGGYIYPTVSITSSGGDALFDVGTHGLSTGRFIYIFSSLSAYNGFWAITVISGTSFKLQNPSGGFVQFINSNVGEYFRYAVNYFTHGWMCVHLPIIYQFKSTLWPINTVDTSRTVSSFANDSNYVQLTLSGSLGSFNALSYLKISGANSSAVNGSFQILTKTSTSVVTINLPYNASYDFTSGSVILYYNNYHVSVNVWSGLDSTHKWTAQKPYSKVLNINIVPGSNNLAMLNINEYLKPSLEVMSNNIVLDTLPNNIEFMTQFYIEYAESYDTSDGTNVTTFTSAFTSDKSTWQGYAVNAKLPFKNRFSGAMSQYIFGNTVLQKFLTNVAIPVLTPGKYFDLSFIMDENIESSGTYIKQQLYKNGTLQSTVSTQIGSGTNNYGIYRFPITLQGTEDTQKVFISNNAGTSIYSETKTITIDNKCYDQSYYLTWLNPLGGFDYWNFTGRSDHDIQIDEVTTQEKNIFPNWPNSWNEFADTITSETKRKSKITYNLRSQNMTKDQLDAVANIRLSPLVQLIYDNTISYLFSPDLRSVSDDTFRQTRTLLLDKNSFHIRKDGDKTFNISFNAVYTDYNSNQEV